MPAEQGADLSTSGRDGTLAAEPLIAPGVDRAHRKPADKNPSVDRAFNESTHLLKQSRRPGRGRRTCLRQRNTRR